MIGLVDTNCDPDDVDFVIPGNDDAIRACSLIVRVIADGVSAGGRRVDVTELTAGNGQPEEPPRRSPPRMWTPLPPPSPRRTRAARTCLPPEPAEETAAEQPDDEPQAEAGPEAEAGRRPADAPAAEDVAPPPETASEES